MSPNGQSKKENDLLNWGVLLFLYVYPVPLPPFPPPKHQKVEESLLLGTLEIPEDPHAHLPMWIDLYLK